MFSIRANNPKWATRTPSSSSTSSNASAGSSNTSNSNSTDQTQDSKKSKKYQPPKEYQLPSGWNRQMKPAGTKDPRSDLENSRLADYPAVPKIPSKYQTKVKQKQEITLSKQQELSEMEDEFKELPSLPRFPRSGRKQTGTNSLSTPPSTSRKWTQNQAALTKPTTTTQNIPGRNYPTPTDPNEVIFAAPNASSSSSTPPWHKHLASPPSTSAGKALPSEDRKGKGPERLDFPETPISPKAINGNDPGHRNSIEEQRDAAFASLVSEERRAGFARNRDLLTSAQENDEHILDAHIATQKGLELVDPHGQALQMAISQGEAFLKQKWAGERVSPPLDAKQQLQLDKANLDSYVKRLRYDLKVFDRVNGSMLGDDSVKAMLKAQTKLANFEDIHVQNGVLKRKLKHLPFMMSDKRDATWQKLKAENEKHTEVRRLFNEREELKRVIALKERKLKEVNGKPAQNP